MRITVALALSLGVALAATPDLLPAQAPPAGATAQAPPAGALVGPLAPDPGVRRLRVQMFDVAAPGPRAAFWPPRTDQPGLAMLASAAVPGAGQLLLGQSRWFPYLAAEVWGWITYLDRRGTANEIERRYRDLAWSVARRISVGERRDTAFEYYETLAHFDASGAYDGDPLAPGVQPETDLETFNGEVWQLARSLFLPGGTPVPVGSAEYQRALSYYQARAVPAGYAWSWGESRLEQQHYSRLIQASDEAFRDATLVLGAIIANHIVSAVDALVSARLRRAGAPEIRIRNRLEPWDRDAAWRIDVRVAW